MMDRGIFLTTVAGLLAAPIAADAQQAGEVYRIAYVSPGSGLAASFTEGRFQVEWQTAQNKEGRPLIAAYISNTR